jgi:hypothetical protein
MKLYDISVGEFVTLLEHSKGNIYLVTDEGVSFNLQSKLSQLYCIKMLLDGSADEKISPEIKIANPEDEKMFLRFLLHHGNRYAFSSSEIKN